MPGLGLVDVKHIAVRPNQIPASNPSNPAGLGLVVNQGKDKDSRSNAFISRHAALHSAYPFPGSTKTTSGLFPIQIEVEAIPPDTRRDLYQDAIDEFFDQDAFDAAMVQEEADKKRLEVIRKNEERREKREGRNQ